MNIAKIANNAVVLIADSSVMFPNTSFAGEPNASFLDENDCLPVCAWLDHNPATHQLKPITPYIANDMVVTVAVTAFTQAELDAKAADALAAVKAQRAEAYRAESDPLFFKAQRGEALMDEWLAKVAEIKARY